MRGLNARLNRLEDAMKARQLQLKGKDSRSIVTIADQLSKLTNDEFRVYLASDQMPDDLEARLAVDLSSMATDDLEDRIAIIDANSIHSEGA
jgi:hypothetical protein